MFWRHHHCSLRIHFLQISMSVRFTAAQCARLTLHARTRPARSGATVSKGSRLLTMGTSVKVSLGATCTTFLKKVKAVCAKNVFIISGFSYYLGSLERFWISVIFQLRRTTILFEFCPYSGTTSIATRLVLVL